MPCFADGIPIDGGGGAITDHWVLAGTQWGYNLAPVSGTWNGVFCNASSSAIIVGSDSHFAAKTFEGSFFDAEAAMANFEFPQGYKAGSDFKILLRWTRLASGTGNVEWNIGTLFGGDTDDLDAAKTYQNQVQSVPAIDARKTAEFSVTGTGAVEGDSLGVVVFRDPDDPQDTFGSFAYLIAVSFFCVKDRWGT
jgi:hypothetical protein